MNYQLSTSSVENATTQGEGKHKTHCSEITSNCSTGSEFSSQSDWQSFVQLLSDSDNEGDIEPIETTPLSRAESSFSLDLLENRDDDSSLETGVYSMVTEYAGIGLSSFFTTAIAQHVSDSVSVTNSAMPGTAATARIVEEMQTRARRNEARRWQISLPGMPGGPVLVTVELQDDDSWVVELCIPGECSDENRKALQRKLTECLQEITLSTPLL